MPPYSLSGTGDICAATHSVLHSSCRPLLSHSSMDYYALPLATVLSLAGLLHVEVCVATTLAKSSARVRGHFQRVQTRNHFCVFVGCCSCCG